MNMAMAASWFASFFEKQYVRRQNRFMNVRIVPLFRSTCEVQIDRRLAALAALPLLYVVAYLLLVTQMPNVSFSGHGPWQRPVEYRFGGSVSERYSSPRMKLIDDSDRRFGFSIPLIPLTPLHRRSQFVARFAPLASASDCHSQSYFAVQRPLDFCQKMCAIGKRSTGKKL